MKRISKYLLIIITVILFYQTVNAQYIGFDPDNGELILCSGTNSSTTFNFYWSWTLSSYPPNVTVGAFAKLITHNDEYLNNVYNTDIGSNIPQQFTLSSGTYTWTIELYEKFLGGSSFIKTAEQTNTFYVKYKLYAANNFSGGSINLEGTSVSSGSNALKIVGESVSVGAIDQNDGSGYYRIWNNNGTYNSNWKKNDIIINGATTRTYQHTVLSSDNGITLIADLKKVCDLVFQANSSMYINSSTRTSPWIESVVEQNSIYAAASSYSSNNIDFAFSHWSSNGQTFSSTITANAHGTFTAAYVGKPNNSIEYVSAGGNVGNPIVVTWTDNPNTAVTQFQIWRKVKHNGVTGSPVLLTTVNRGVQTYTDYSYVVTDGYTDDMIWYDVRAYYSTEGTYSEPDWVAVYGMENMSKQENNSMVQATETEIPSQYSISNYPNPFNPTTKINYQIPESGFVTLKVYDILGKEVATLVNENKQAGYYTATFSGTSLPSGVYIYTIQCNGYKESRKMLLAK